MDGIEEIDGIDKIDPRQGEGRQGEMDGIEEIDRIDKIDPRQGEGQQGEIEEIDGIDGIDSGLIRDSGDMRFERVWTLRDQASDPISEIRNPKSYIPTPISNIRHPESEIIHPKFSRPSVSPDATTDCSRLATGQSPKSHSDQGYDPTSDIRN